MMTGGVTDLVYFIRVGTLDKPDRLPPDVHIHIASKQPWVALPEGALAFDGSYRGKAQEVWSADSLKRLDVL